MLSVGTWNTKEEGSESERMGRGGGSGREISLLMQTQACEYIATIQCNMYDI